MSGLPEEDRALIKRVLSDDYEECLDAEIFMTEEVARLLQAARAEERAKAVGPAVEEGVVERVRGDIEARRHGFCIVQADDLRALLDAVTPKTGGGNG